MSPSEVMTIDTLITAIHRPVKTRDEIFDRSAITEYLDAAYGARLRLKQSRACSDPLRHSRIDIGAVTLDDLQLPGTFEASPDPLNRVVAVWTDRGRVSGRCGDLAADAGPDEVAVLSQPDLPFRARFDDAHTTTVLLDPGLIASEAGAPAGADTPTVRFSSLRPVDDAAASLWRDTVGYLKNSVLSRDEVATPLVLAQCSRLLAAVTLAAFPNAVGPAHTPYDRTDTGSGLLRRAIAYIEANVDDDIALADIADAVHVTPRAVQYMFRRHLDTTPLQYVRRLRLDLAHRDLLAAQRTEQTVTQIAARWGFAHTGRFAVIYRQTFGQSPYETLRG